MTAGPIRTPAPTAPLNGDEIGLTDGPIERDDVLDAVGARFWPYYKGRDAERTPMPWSSAPGGGFTSPGTRTWLPMADPAESEA